MNRRQFLALSAISATAPATLMAAEANFVDYSREAFDEVLASGKPVLLDFFAPW